MSLASFAVTYTSVYTDSKPGRVFWGADEELSDEGSPNTRTHITIQGDGRHDDACAPMSMGRVVKTRLRR
uniref:Uncharacterized protein n=1 Tax=Tanacetum cinerariifolium TaxID=118510 RepID=A0A699I313_TANCI|nr:hypothetical protein [Tanacetum cinerariifolium]